MCLYVFAYALLEVSGQVSPVALLPCDRTALFVIIRAPANSIQRPHETTMKPVMKPLGFYQCFDETGGIDKEYYYLLQLFFL